MTAPGGAPPVRLGTRRSALALAQSRQVGEQITALTGRAVELVEIVTEGDRSARALTEIGGTGVFVTALREALLEGRVDLAVHSFKDLPTAPAPGLTLAAVPRRADPRDALVCPGGASLAELADGARIGTGSPRRAAQLRALGLGLQVVPIRGNVDSRIRQAVDGSVDAVVLARAGLARLGREDVITEVLDPLQMLPAPAQGALAVECRAGDPLVAALGGLDDPRSRAAVAAERALLGALEAGCAAPVAALAEVEDPDPSPEAEVGGGPSPAGEIYLRAVVSDTSGRHMLRISGYGPGGSPEALGRRLADELLADGASDLMGKE